MDKIERQVRRAQRRLGLQRFVGLLGWTCTATLTAAALLILVDRFWSLGVPAWGWLAGAAALGLLAAWLWTVASGSDPIDAAIELDRQFELKERVSSTLALSDADRETPSGQALVRDTARRVERINVADRMKVTAPRRLLFPLVPAAIALALVMLVGPAKQGNTAQAQAAGVRQQVKKSTKKLQRRLDQHRKKAEKQGLKEIKNVLKLLQQDLKKLQQSPPADRKEALRKLNDLAKQLQERRDDFSAAEKLQQQLKQLKNLKQGPADRLAKAMKQGDFGKAADELNKLRQQLSSEKLSKEQREQLAKQFDQMAEKLKKAAEAHQQMQANLQKEIQKLRDAGDSKKASELEEQLAKLRSQLPQMDMLKQMGKELKECSKCCKEGQLGEAQEAMQQLAEGLQGMQQEMDELEMLDDAMDQLAQCRGQMGCPGFDEGDLENGQPMQDPFARPGGLKAGVGHVPGGVRGAKPDVALHNSQVRANVGKGSMKVGGYLDGPNRKGDVGEVIHEQVEAVKHGQTDPLTNQQMPRRHRDHAQEYIERLREGK